MYVTQVRIDSDFFLVPVSSKAVHVICTGYYKSPEPDSAVGEKGERN